MRLPYVVDTRRFFRALEEAGVISDAERVESVAIYADRHGPVSVEVHLLAPEEILNLVPDLYKEDPK